MNFRWPASPRRAIAASLLAGLCAAGTVIPCQAATPVGAKRVQQSAGFRSNSLDGQQLFALEIQAKQLPAVEGGHDHIVLIDTSASQVAAHRRQGIAVLEAFFSALPATDRVHLKAVDVAPKALMDGFHPAASEETQQALATLKKRVPLGATDLEAALQSALATVPGEQRPASVVYIGDGMSTAGLIGSAELEQLLQKLRSSRVPVHSYAVGPRTDLQLLGVLAQRTGGMLMFDDADARKDAPAAAGSRLAAAANAPVFYPETLKYEPAGLEVLPAVALPLRSDRSTVYLARGLAAESVQLTLSAQSQSVSESLPVGRMTAAGPFLQSLWNQAETSDGLTVAYAGRSVLQAAQRAYESEIVRLEAAGEQAVGIRELDRAEQIGQAILKLDPANVRAQAMLGASDRVRNRILAQADAAQPPAAQPPAAQPPAADNGLQARQEPVDPAEIDLIQQEQARRRIKLQRLTLEVADV
ncbi:MAG: VWA domain-containing protein, partial [Planctomycetaceae bacterium]|nr:VWA domain-containing protein [Planctomycetaceae bacterium]